MTTPRSFRVLLLATVVGLPCLLGLLLIVDQLESERDYQNSKTSGLAAGPEVGFDTVSMWRQQSISGAIGRFLYPSQVSTRLPSPPASPASIALVRNEDFNTEAYDSIADNPFVDVAVNPRATFSSDVDTASYANIRRFVTQGERPPQDSVRIEEMINYFSYDYPQPVGPHPIAVETEVGAAPWKPEHRLVRIGLKSKDIDMANRSPSNLVFLIDVSGSMDDPAKLPLLQNALKLLVNNLSANDHVAVVVYAGSEGLVLPPTAGNETSAIVRAIEELSPNGSTNGAAGIQLAYKLAASNFITRGINRVVLATDGDFNVGVTNEGALVRLIEEKAKTGVFLSVLGFGMGNIKDSMLEKLADKGNGNYAYIDTLNEARKVLVEEMGGTLVTVAKDVKIQVEFNPSQVRAYRLIGYENRVLKHEDFNNDAKDAGDMGAGHNVTALFEVVPIGVAIALPAVDALKYQSGAGVVRGDLTGEILNVKIRYKEPSGEVSRLIETPVRDRNVTFAGTSSDFRFAAAVAAFGMILRDSPHKGNTTLDTVMNIAEAGKGADRNGYRTEFVELVRKMQALKK